MPRAPEMGCGASVPAGELENELKIEKTKNEEAQRQLDHMKELYQRERERNKDLRNQLKLNASSESSTRTRRKPPGSPRCAVRGGRWRSRARRDRGCTRRAGRAGRRRGARGCGGTRTRGIGKPERRGRGKSYVDDAPAEEVAPAPEENADAPAGDVVAEPVEASSLPRVEPVEVEPAEAEPAEAVEADPPNPSPPSLPRPSPPRPSRRWLSRSPRRSTSRSRTPRFGPYGPEHEASALKIQTSARGKPARSASKRIREEIKGCPYGVMDVSETWAPDTAVEGRRPG